MNALPFREIWLCDFEFAAPDGERPTVRCMVALELRSGKLLRLWDPAPSSESPIRRGPDVLFVAYFASAELGCYLSLGWPMPTYVLDLYVEFKRMTCGKEHEPGKPSLVYALDWFGLESLDITEKDEMRELALRPGEYTHEERQALTDYCERDVRALERLLPRMLSSIDLPRAVLRGQFMKAVACMEHNGIPIDMPTLRLLNEHWETLKAELVGTIDAQFKVYDGTHFREERFYQYLASHDIPWPRHSSGELCLDDDAFGDMAKVYPVLQPLRHLRQMMAMLHLANLPVGNDGRNRFLFSPFGTITGRCTPSTTRFIFSRPAWMRSLIRPEEGKALAYIDWSSQEYGIGAALSGDGAMLADYEAGDPYLGFAKRIGMVPNDATKETHRQERDIVKAVILGTQYGMGEQSLAARIGKSVAHARELLRMHRRTYRKFWTWSDAAVNCALFGGRLWTRFGWQTHPKDEPNARSLANFPCQGNAADMLRLAAQFIVEDGPQLDATIHDAVLIEAKVADIDAAVGKTQEAMRKASRLVLDGFELRSEPEVIAWPHRYSDTRGAAFFAELMSRLDAARKGA